MSTAEQLVSIAKTTLGITNGRLNQYSLAPANGHFQELNRILRGMIFSSEEQNTPVETLLKDSLRDQPNGVSHTAQLSDLAELYVRPLVSRFSTLRNRLIPLVTTVVTEIDKQYTATTLTQTEIAPVEVAELYSNQHFRELLSRHKAYSQIATKNIKFLGGFLDRTEEQIVTLIQTGNTALDDAIIEVLSKHESGWIKSVYDRYFVEGSILPSNITKNMLAAYLDEAFLCYFVVHGLHSRQIIDGSVNIDLESYRKYIVDLLTAIGGFMYRLTNYITTVIADGEILSHKDPEKNIYYVFRPNYDKYLAEGGSPDALLGCALNNDTIYLRQLLTDGPKYLEVYERYYNKMMDVLKAEYKSKIASLFREVFSNMFPNLEKETIALFATALPAGSIDINNVTPANARDISIIITNQFENVARESIFDIVMYSILSIGMMKKNGLDTVYRQIEHRSNNDGVTPTEAAFVVALDEITKAVASTCISKVSP